MNLSLLAAAAATLAAGAALAQPAMAPAGAPMSAGAYVMAAGQSDLFEIQEGRIAQRMGATAKVRAFGKQMVADHSKSTGMVIAAAKASGMHPAPPMLTPAQRAMVQKLETTHGAAFDSLYVQQQLTAHQQALQVQQGYAQTGGDANLKLVAGKIVPVVEHHISELQSMGGASAM